MGLGIYKLNRCFYIRVQAFMYRAAMGRGLKHRALILRNAGGHMKDDIDTADAPHRSGDHFFAHINGGPFKVNIMPGRRNAHDGEHAGT